MEKLFHSTKAMIRFWVLKEEKQLREVSSHFVRDPVSLANHVTSAAVEQKSELQTQKLKSVFRE